VAYRISIAKAKLGCGNDGHPNGTRRAEQGSVARSRVSAVGRDPATPGAATVALKLAEGARYQMMVMRP
jgi:hypothetical protein